MFTSYSVSGPLRYLLLALVFALVIIVVMLVFNFINNRSAVRGRLAEVQSGAANIRQGSESSLRGDSIAVGWNRLTEMIERTGISLVDTKAESLRAKLIAAGYNAPEAPKIFTVLRLGLLVAMPTLFVSAYLVNVQQPSLLKLYIFGVIFGLLGLYLPNLWVSAKADRRRQEIINGFPDCLDLMLVCVEAGLGMEAAFDRVGKEMLHSHPLVAQMLSIVTLELRAGSTREEALRNMADNAQVDEIRSFSTLLIQSDKLGSSIGDTLRVYATEMRERRKMRAEEKAHRLPVLLSVPLVACMLPVMIGVLMLPAVVRILRQVAPALAGG